MLVYLAKRIVAAAAVVVVVSFLIFWCLYLAPGSPEQAILGPTTATPATIAQVRQEFGLNDPFIVQYWHFLRGIFSFNLGTSYQTGQTVAAGIGSRVAVTLPLALGGFVVSTILGVAGGVVAAQRRGRALDKIIGGIGIAAASTPAFATGVLLLLVFGIKLKWFPVTGDGSGFAGRADHLVLPIITLGLLGTATILRRTRNAVALALERDDVAFARARGVSPSAVLYRYVLRHAAVIIVTSASVMLIYMLAATAIVESIFGMNGIGVYLINAINTKDMPSIQGVAVLITILVVLINLGTDLLYAVIDPRIQHGASAR
jgi:peptide/nickel transport system permease protein